MATSGLRRGRPPPGRGRGIASSAQANKRLTYDYVGDKDGLFDAVLNAHTEQIIGAVPMHATDLSAYAGERFDYMVGHPDLRLTT